MKIFEDYKQTKQAIDILMAELKELKPKVVKELKKNDGLVELKDVSFSLRSMKTYKYSEATVGLENKIKTEKKAFESKIAGDVKELARSKKEEVKNGDAIIKSESFTPVMKVIKK